MNYSKALTPAELRDIADAKDKEAQDSFDRCDTDGFLSQWASELGAQRARLEADIRERGGRWEFRALFNEAGELVPAKQVRVRDPRGWGTKLSWALLSSDDPNSSFTGWFSESWDNNDNRRIEKNLAKGYRMGWVLAPAKADYVGHGKGLSGSCTVSAVRTDGGFSRDVEVLEIETVTLEGPDPFGTEMTKNERRQARRRAKRAEDKKR